MKKQNRTGWGRSSYAESSYLEIEHFSADCDLGNGWLPVGLGRSYGDSSLLDGGTYWCTRKKNQIVIDVETQQAICESGATIGELERRAIEFGLFPPTVPGTEYVSIGGAVASDVHGKSHHSVGSFGNSLVEITLLDPMGRTKILKPIGESRNEFWATVGGMGLTGIVLSVRLNLIPVQSAFFEIKEVKVQTLQEMLETIIFFDSQYKYTVAWIDLSGSFIGRGIVTGGNHAPVDNLTASQQINPFRANKVRTITLPDIFPSWIINKHSIKLFNSLWFKRKVSVGIQHFSEFLHPLDSLKKWNRIYGKNGFIQYQIQVPIGAEDFLKEVLNELGKIGAASALGVLKKFGRFENGYLSFPSEGWTLAVDIPAGTTGLEQCLNSLDKKLIECGGKVYLTKDSRVSREDFRQMYPSHNAWMEIKSEMDPNSNWRSNQGKRLGLC